MRPVAQPTDAATTAAYAAFISYSHADEGTAKWLHRKLEAYRTPRPLIGREGRYGAIPARVGKVFRDREEFGAGGELRREIESALDRSTALIVLCSPRSAASTYVAAEIDYFGSRGRGDRIIPVIVDGEPPECFPRPLRDGAERLGADFRAHKDGRDAGLLKVLAGLHGVPLDELVQRERVAQRWRLRAAIAAVAVFAGLAVVATILGWLANRNANLAQTRAALMAIDGARAQLAEGETDAALLVLLDAASTLGPSLPDSFLIAFQEALERAEGEIVVPIPSGARLFRGSKGVYVSDSQKGVLSIVDASGALRTITTFETPVAAVMETNNSSLYLVREDLRIEEHVEGKPPRVLGHFERRGADDDLGNFDIQLVDGLLLWQPEEQSDGSTDYPVAQVFDVRTRAISSVNVPRSVRLSYARLGDGRRVIFEQSGFAANIDAPPTVEELRRREGTDAAVPGFPGFAELTEQSCLTAIRPTDSQRAALRTLATEERGVSVMFVCHVVDADVLVRVERATSAGIERIFTVIDRYGQATVLGPGLDDGLDATWADLAEGDGNDETEGAKAYVVGRRVRLTGDAPISDGLLDRTFPYYVKFAAFVPGKQLVIAEQGRDRLRILKYGLQTNLAFRTLAGDIETSPEPLLHPTACQGSPYAAPTASGARLSVKANPTPDEYSGPLTFKVTLDSSQGRFERDFVTDAAQRCVAIARGGRYVAVGETSDRMQVHDLTKAQKGEPSKIGEFEAHAWGDPSLNGWGAIFFLNEGPSVIAASGDRPVVRWDYSEENQSWTATELYRGDVPIRSAEPDRSGRRLLLREDIGNGDVAARIYSLDAARTWRALGRDYKWLHVFFSEKDEAFVGKHHQWVWAVRMINGEEAVRTARERLSSTCRSFPANEFRQSPCWPSALGR
jgi:hypothetical protein